MNGDLGLIYLFWIIGHLNIFGPLFIFVAAAPPAITLALAFTAYRRNNAPLIKAAREGRADTARVLLDQGANIDAASMDGKTALIHAASKGHVEVARLLLEKGANAGLKNKSGRTASMIAAAKGHAEIVDLLKRQVRP